MKWSHKVSMEILPNLKYMTLKSRILTLPLTRRRGSITVILKTVSMIGLLVPMRRIAQNKAESKVIETLD